MCVICVYVGDGSVVLSVSRVGTLDTVDLQWSVGPLLGGGLTPLTGSVSLSPSQSMATFSLTVSHYNTL